MRKQDDLVVKLAVIEAVEGMGRSYMTHATPGTFAVLVAYEGDNELCEDKGAAVSLELHVKDGFVEIGGPVKADADKLAELFRKTLSQHAKENIGREKAEQFFEAMAKALDKSNDEDRASVMH